MTAISSLKDQYGCTSFTASALVDSQPCIKLVESALCDHLLGLLANFLCHHAFWDVCICFYSTYVQSHLQYFFISAFGVVVPR